MRKKIASLLTLLLVAGTFQVLAAEVASAATLNVGYTLEGCTLAKGTYDQTTATCDDAGYTTGDLKGWNELDLVPFRVTLDNNGATSQTGQFVVAGDYKNNAGTATGWDLISTLTLNTANSDAGCPAVTSGAQTITPSGGGVGGADQTIYRTITATIPAGKTCVYDYYMRVALGAHNFSGNSMQANLWNPNLQQSGVGQKRVSIGVNEIEPPEIRKDMSATQGSDVAWNVTKEATPAELHFGDICDTTNPTSLTTDITITWTKGEAVPAGDVLVTTNVYVKNNASRDLTANVTDVIKSGTTALDTHGPVSEVISANTEELVFTHTKTITAAQAVNLNDVATATFTDTFTGVPIPGSISATATASVESNGTVTNNSAVITDSEEITGTGATFSVADPGSGSFTNYTADDEVSPGTTVEWSSGTVTDSGSVTFTKTVNVSGDADATLADTATLTGADGFTTEASASVDIDASTLATVTIDKTTTIPVDGDTDFVFDIKDSGDNVVGSITVTIADGETSGSATSDFTLDDGDYTAVETDAGGFSPAADLPFTIDAGECNQALDIENSFGFATASALKVTVPAGGEEGVTFNLYLDNAPAGPGNEDELISSVQTDANGVADFGQVTDEGDYYITEDVPDGYVQSDVSGCTFTVNYPADADAVFDDCQITNTLLVPAHARVKKVTDPTGNEAGFEFTLYLDDDGTPGAGDPNDDTVIGTVTTTGAGYISFPQDLEDGDYYILETPKTGWENTGTSGDCSFSVSLPADNDKTFSCTFNNQARGTISVAKLVNNAATADTFVFELRKNAAAPATEGTVLDTKTVTANGTAVQLNGDLTPGTYQVCEVVPAGWQTNLGPNPFQLSVSTPNGPDNSRTCVNVQVTVANQDITVNVSNTPPPGGGQRTIGYWKNWASCSKSSGKQDPVLDETLYSFPNHGIWMGSSTLAGKGIFIDTCAEAANVLSKTAQNGTKKASDPLFNMAAQLLAAELNIKAGASHCTSVDNAIIAANNLLVKYGWNGNSYTGNLSNADKTSANQLNGLLDNYNNGKVC